ncbi:MAG: Lrp/AsnC ligand binding domain-containing protein [Candidatus Marsarchaeota archaeon]|nr:Lrp/AsnC ligand binding domain-containing protein [Candidatus Marsarchaeota archaeon]
MPGSVKVYVRSEKIPVGVAEITSRTPTGLGELGTIERSSPMIQYDYQVPDDQKNLLLLVKEVCEERGYVVEIVDLSREGIIKKIREPEIVNATDLPVVVTPTGEKLVGKSITRSSLEKLLPADMSGRELRAFVYIKCKKGSENRLVEDLMRLKEVKEVHLIPGEWDALAVVGLTPSGGSGERTAVDFVMNKVRKLDAVESTSTMTPVYSYTKFPLS